MSEILQAAIGALMLTYFAVVRPSSHRCVIGSPEGIRPSGITRCLVPPSGRGERECVRGSPCSFPPTQRIWYPVRIYCTGGAHAIDRGDGVTVGCMR